MFMEYHFPFPHFQSVCFPRYEGSFFFCRQILYRSCFCIHLASLYFMVGVFNPFTFKLLLICMLLCYFLNCLDLFCRSFFLPFSFCSSLLKFHDYLQCCVYITFSFLCLYLVFILLFIFYVCIYCRVLVCSYHEVWI